VPLSIYLLSFIITFRSHNKVPRVYTAFATLLGTTAGISVINIADIATLPTVLAVLWTALFLVSHYCHEWLYEHRPPIRFLPWFYVSLSFGGVIGSMVILASTLYVFNAPNEFLGLLILVQLLALYHLYQERKAISSWLPNPRLYGMIGFVALLLVAIFVREYVQSRQVVDAKRNFYGAKMVYKQDSLVWKRLVLIHEGTTHGYQYQTGPHQQSPTSYYVETSGLGRAFSYLKEKNDMLRVGAVGLGVGTVSAYCRSNDALTFFEIDPQVVTIAQTYFSYLEQCPQHTIMLGDARQLLKKELSENVSLYHLIIIDAYADDAVPAHLMTEEAMALYLRRLAPGGMVAFHISSRYLDLLPVVAGIAKRHHLSSRYFNDTTAPSYGNNSLWVLVSQDEEIFANDVFQATTDLSTTTPLFWTDTKNAIFPLIRFFK